jgi:cell division protein FtsN
MLVCFNYQLDEDFFIPILLDKTKTSVVEDQTALHQPETSSTADKSFHLIGGCFSIKENADKFVLDLKEKGFNASILDFENGLYRVTAGSFSDASEADQNLTTFVNQGFSGWVLKK